MDQQQQPEDPSSQLSETSSTHHEGLADLNSEEEDLLLNGGTVTLKVKKVKAGGKPPQKPSSQAVNSAKTDDGPVRTGGQPPRSPDPSATAGEGEVRTDGQLSGSPLPSRQETELVNAMETSCIVSDPNLGMSENNAGSSFATENVVKRPYKRPNKDAHSRRGQKSGKPRSSDNGDSSSRGSTSAPGNKRKMASPTDAEAPAKKSVGRDDNHRQGHRPLYSDAVKKDLTVFIQSQKGSLSRNMIAEIREKICEKIDEIPSGEKKPTFENISTSDGMLELTCSDSVSKNWLVGVIEATTCSDGTALRHSTDPAAFALNKMSVYILDSKNTSTERIFKRFQDQNTGLDVSSWTFYKELDSRNPNGRHLLIGVDQESREFILNRGKRLHYMLQTIKVDIKSGNSRDSAAERRYRK